MAKTVTGAFSEYKSNLEITDRQASLVSTRRTNVVNVLAKGLTLHTETSLLIGSYDRNTMTRFLSEGDVDVMVVLNYGKHKDWKNAGGTVKALDAFRKLLVDAYPNTTIRRDVNCVTMQFSEFRLDVVPAFKFDTGDYEIPDSVRKEWVRTNPIKFADRVTNINKAMGSSYVPLVKMIKGWNRQVGWPIKSFHLECIMHQRYSSYTQGFTYDSMVKVFFENLPGYLDMAIHDPVSGDRVDGYLDNGGAPSRRSQAISRAKSARDTAVVAYGLQETDQPAAVRKWSALMGEFFPAYG